MAVTRDQAIKGGVFHTDHNEGGKIYRWRSNGKCKTWKTRPDEFKLPVKYGLYDYGYITQDNAEHFHHEDDCPDGVR